MTEQRAPGELVSDAATVDARKAVKIEDTVTIRKQRNELYALWRNFDQLPKYVDDLESVTSLGNGRSHWVAKLPGGKTIEWDAALVNEIPNELIAWKTVNAPDVAHAGSVHFKDTSGGTEMRVVLDYEPPGSAISHLLAAFTKLFGKAPEAKIKADLEQFKRRVEGGSSA